MKNDSSTAEMETLKRVLGEKIERESRDKIISEIFGVPAWTVTFPILCFWVAVVFGILYLIFRPA